MGWRAHAVSSGVPSMPPMIEPVRIEQPSKKTLKIKWKDGKVLWYDAYRLRLACPCAVCVDEWTGRKLIDDEAVPEWVLFFSMDLVGRYALAFKFSDGHDTGIYSFDMLYKLGSATPPAETAAGASEGAARREEPPAP